MEYQDWTSCEVHGHLWEVDGEEVEFCTDCGERSTAHDD